VEVLIPSSFRGLQEALTGGIREDFLEHPFLLLYEDYRQRATF
jgi:hypothetical protein